MFLMLTRSPAKSRTIQDIRNMNRPKLELKVVAVIIPVKHAKIASTARM